MLLVVVPFSLEKKRYSPLLELAPDWSRWVAKNGWRWQARVERGRGYTMISRNNLHARLIESIPCHADSSMESTGTCLDVSTFLGVMEASNRPCPSPIGPSLRGALCRELRYNLHSCNVDKSCVQPNSFPSWNALVLDGVRPVTISDGEQMGDKL